MRAVHAEFLRVFTVKTWWILALIMVPFVGLTSLTLASFATFLPVGEQHLAVSAYSSALSAGYIFPLLMGALAVTGEYRHDTIISTFLTTPNRVHALAAKLCTQFVIGLLFAVMAYAAAIAAAAALFFGYDYPNDLGSAQTWMVILRGCLAMGLWAIIGVGLGSLIPNQAAVIVIALAFTQFIEPLLRLVSLANPVFTTIGQFLPGAASDTLGGSSALTVLSAPSTDPGLPWWAGGLVLIAYAVVFSIAGYFARWSRDV